MGLKERLKEKTLMKAQKKINDQMPALLDFAVNNDKAYEALVLKIRTINDKRKQHRKYIHAIHASRG